MTNQEHQKHPLLRLFFSAKRYWGLLFATVLSLFVLTAAQLVGPAVVRELTRLIRSADPNLRARALQLAALLGVVYLLQAIAQGLRQFLAHQAAWHFVSELRVRLYDHYQTLSMGFFHDKQIGQLMSRVISDTDKVELFIAHAGPDLVVNLILFLGISILLLLLNWRLALMGLLVLPFLGISSLWFSKKIRPRFRAGRQLIGNFSAKLQDNLSGMKEIQLFHRQKQERDTINRLSLQHVKAILWGLSISAFYHPGIQFLSSLGTVLVIGYGGTLAAKGVVPLEDLVAFMLYLGVFYQPISSLSRIMEDIQDTLSGAERIYEVLDTAPTVTESPDAVALSQPQGLLKFDNVSFHYYEHTEILKDLSFTVQPGKKIALVGQTGAGKTTIASLLGRFYDPTKGQILLDGHDLRDLTLESLRDSMSIVLQDVFLFDGTVKENISYGQPNATDTQILEASRLSCAQEFIEKLEDGYDTRIGERGVRLSGGQKQRLSIARALLRDRPVLILDEATSAVDVETEQLIQRAMDQVMERRTTVIIAHRLSTVKKADQIIVLHEGEIAERGTHDELMEKNGIYASYYEKTLSE